MASMTWHRVLTGALVALSLAFVVIMGVAGVIIPPLVVFAVVFAFLAAAIQRWSTNRWLLLLTALLSVFVIAGNLPAIITDIAHPETFSTFAPTFVALVAAIVALKAGIAGAFGIMPWVTRLVGMDSARLVGVGAIVLVAVGLLGSMVATAMAGDVARVEGDVTVVAENVEYPERLEAKAGNVGFFIDNRDGFRHTFVIVEPHRSQELPGSRTRRLEVTLPAGSYKYICDVLGHEQMEGILEVQ
jgi:plastocyanin